MSWELGWVVKKHGAMEYLAVDPSGLFHWVDNALKALHFYRDEDAKSFLAAIHMLARVEYASLCVPSGLHERDIQPDIVHYAWM